MAFAKIANSAGTNAHYNICYLHLHQAGQTLPKQYSQVSSFSFRTY